MLDAHHEVSKKDYAFKSEYNKFNHESHILGNSIKVTLIGMVQMTPQCSIFITALETHTFSSNIKQGSETIQDLLLDDNF